MSVEPQPRELHTMRFHNLLKWLRGRMGFDLVQCVRYVSSHASDTLTLRTRFHLVNIRHGTCARTFGLEEQLQLVVKHSATKRIHRFTVALENEVDLHVRCRFLQFIGSAAMLAVRACASPEELTQLPAPPLTLRLTSVVVGLDSDPVTGVRFVS